MKSKKMSKNIYWIIFIIYCAFMLVLLFHRDIAKYDNYSEEIMRNMNIRPFHTIELFLNVLKNSQNDVMITHAIFNLIGNVVLFVPFGFLFPKLFVRSRRFSLFIFNSFIIIFLVEATQLFTLRGSFDIDDFILNLSGILIGFAIFKIFSPKRNIH